MQIKSLAPLAQFNVDGLQISIMMNPESKFMATGISTHLYSIMIIGIINQNSVFWQTMNVLSEGFFNIIQIFIIIQMIFGNVGNHNHLRMILQHLTSIFIRFRDEKLS